MILPEQRRIRGPVVKKKKIVHPFATRCAQPSDTPRSHFCGLPVSVYISIFITGHLFYSSDYFLFIICILTLSRKLWRIFQGSGLLLTGSGSTSQKKSIGIRLRPSRNNIIRIRRILFPYVPETSGDGISFNLF